MPIRDHCGPPKAFNTFYNFIQIVPVNKLHNIKTSYTYRSVVKGSCFSAEHILHNMNNVVDMSGSPTQ